MKCLFKNRKVKNIIAGILVASLIVSLCAYYQPKEVQAKDKDIKEKTKVIE